MVSVVACEEGTYVPLVASATRGFDESIDLFVAIPWAGHLSQAAVLLAAINGKQEQYLLLCKLASIPDLHNALRDLPESGPLAGADGELNIVLELGLDIDHACLEAVSKAILIQAGEMLTPRGMTKKSGFRALTVSYAPGNACFISTSPDMAKRLKAKGCVF